MSIYIGNDLEDRLKALETENVSLIKYNEYHQVVKSVQSALSDLKRPLNVYSPSAIIGLSLLNSIFMARFLKQSFA